MELCSELNVSKMDIDLISKALANPTRRQIFGMAQEATTIFVGRAVRWLWSWCLCREYREAR